MSYERLRELLEAVRNVVMDFLVVVIEFMEHIVTSLNYKGGSFNEVIEGLKLWNDVAYEVTLLFRDYVQLVYETRTFMHRLLSLVGDEGLPSRIKDMRLNVDLNSSKIALRNLMENGFSLFDEHVNVVWGRMLRLSSIASPIDENAALKLRSLFEEEIRRWVGEGSAVMGAYSRALATEDEEEFVREVLNVSSGPSLLLDGLKKIASAFELKPDPTTLPLDHLSEIIKIVMEAIPYVVRGLEARLNMHRYTMNTLFNMLRVLHVSDRKAFSLLDWLIEEITGSRGKKAVLKLLPENISLEELRVGLVIARTNLEDSLRELPNFKLMLEKVSIILSLIDIPFIRRFYEEEKELVKHVELFVNQALKLARDANFRAYEAMEELKRLSMKS